MHGRCSEPIVRKRLAFSHIAFEELLKAFSSAETATEQQATLPAE